MRGSCVAKMDGAFNPYNIQNKVADPRKMCDYAQLGTAGRWREPAREPSQITPQSAGAGAGGDLLPRGKTTPAVLGDGH